jgi:hypothetical protein
MEPVARFPEGGHHAGGVGYLRGERQRLVGAAGSDCLVDGLHGSDTGPEHPGLVDSVNTGADRGGARHGEQVVCAIRAAAPCGGARGVEQQAAEDPDPVRLGAGHQSAVEPLRRLHSDALGLGEFASPQLPRTCTSARPRFKPWRQPRTHNPRADTSAQFRSPTGHYFFRSG